MTKTQNLMITIGGVKGDGKTLLAVYYMEKINKPTIIIDVARQFTNSRKFRTVVKGVQELKYELNHNRKSFMKYKTQIVFRPETKDITKEIEEVIEFVDMEEIENICIFFDEIETYATSKITNKSSLYKLFYISRNMNIDIISVVKTFGDLSRLIKGQTDYFAISKMNEINSIKFLDQRSNNKFSPRMKELNKHEFLVTDLNNTWTKIKLDKKIIRIIEK